MYWACNRPCKRRMRTEPNDIKRKAISSDNGPDHFRGEFEPELCAECRAHSPESADFYRKMKMRASGWILLFALLTTAPAFALNGVTPAGGTAPAGGVGTTNANAPRWRPDFFRRIFGPTTPFETPGIELKPFVIDHRHASNSLIDLSFLLEAPAGKDGFIHAKGDQLVKGNGQPIRFWGFNITEWSHGSTEVPSKEDAPMWADALARAGVNIVRLQFLDLAAPRGLIDGTRDDSQHFDPVQLDNEDFFLSELMRRGIYIDFNLNVGRAFKTGDNVARYTGRKRAAAFRPAPDRAGERLCPTTVDPCESLHPQGVR